MTMPRAGDPNDQTLRQLRCTAGGPAPIPVYTAAEDRVAFGPLDQPPHIGSGFGAPIVAMQTHLACGPATNGLATSPYPPHEAGLEIAPDGWVEPLARGEVDLVRLEAAGERVLDRPD